MKIVLLIEGAAVVLGLIIMVVGAVLKPPSVYGQDLFYSSDPDDPFDVLGPY